MPNTLFEIYKTNENLFFDNIQEITNLFGLIDKLGKEFNVNKAKVFMGDTGSLSLGGFIASITIFSSNSCGLFL